MKENKKIIGSIVIIIILGVFSLIGYEISKPAKVSKDDDIFIEKCDKNDKKKNSTNIEVYINGEVNKPGVYKLRDDSRLQELINKAGGYTKNANVLKLNLAKKLKDEDYIFVENKDDKKKNNNSNNNISNSSQNLKEKIDVNSGSKEELKSIPGIGEVTAQKIIDYREEKGNFSKIEDLKKIDRIGEKTLEKIKDKAEVR
ncbi:ComEA family DNA-binding protein [Clostridium oceanicum]|uniref:Helix-hairpin-helix domain-containing protein n=1 Tax=Clostridium oceanicum TaxID=1543 RepID=A0ABP3V357_9CLOT